MKKYLDLKDAVVVDKPGGGQLIGTNTLYHAKPDGLTIGDTSGAGDVFAVINDTAGVKFDPRKFEWLGRVDYDVHVIATHADGPYQTFDDLVALKDSGKTLKAFGVGKGGTAYNTEVITYNAFDIPFHMVAGFSGSHAEEATFVAGQGDAFSAGTTNMKHLGSDVVTIVLAMKAGKRFEAIPHVPTVIEEAKKHNVPKDTADTLKAATNLIILGHTFTAPPGVPKDRLAALRGALKKTFNDPGFIKKEKKAGYYPGYKSGPAIAEVVSSGLDHKRQISDLLKVH